MVKTRLLIFFFLNFRNYKKDHGWSIVSWCGPHTIVTTTRFSEVITFQTEPLQTHKDGLQFKFKLVHDRHKSKPILCLACPQTTELDVGMDQVIWTLAVDRHLIRYSLQQLSLTLDLNTCTSYVFGLALSIVPDQSRLAIGKNNDFFVPHISQCTAQYTRIGTLQYFLSYFYQIFHL